MVINLAMASLRRHLNVAAQLRVLMTWILIPADKVMIHYSHSRVNLLCRQGAAVQGKVETSAIKEDFTLSKETLIYQLIYFNISVNNISQV